MPRKRKSKHTEVSEQIQDPLEMGCYVIEETAESEQLMYACNSCNITFDTEDKNNIHRSLNHPTKVNDKVVRQYLRYKCYACNVISANKLDIKYHLEKIHLHTYSEGTIVQITQQKCVFCLKSYINTDTLIKHAINEHQFKDDAFKPMDNIEIITNYKFKCPSCTVFVANPPLLYAHIKNYHLSIYPDIEKQPLSVKSTVLYTYKCSYCQLEYKTAESLIKHKKQMHTDEILTTFQSELEKQNKKCNNKKKTTPVRKTSKKQCKICRIYLQNEYVLKLHLKTQHDINDESGPSSGEIPIVYIKPKNKVATKVNDRLKWVNNSNPSTSDCSIRGSYQLVPNSNFTKNHEYSKIQIVKPSNSTQNSMNENDGTVVNYYCHYCNECMKDSIQMKMHLTNVHEIPYRKADREVRKCTTYSKKYQCDMCKLRFKTIELLEAHIEIEILKLEMPSVNFEYTAPARRVINEDDDDDEMQKLQIKRRSKKKSDDLESKLDELPSNLRTNIKIDYKYLFHCPKCDFISQYHMQLTHHVKEIHKAIIIPEITSILTKIWVCILCTKVQHNRVNFYSTKVNFISHFKEYHSKCLTPMNKITHITYKCLSCYSTFSCKEELDTHQVIRNCNGSDIITDMYWKCDACTEIRNFQSERSYVKHYKDYHLQGNIVKPAELVECKMVENYSNVKVEDTEIVDTTMDEPYITPEFCCVGIENDPLNTEIVIKDEPIDMLDTDQ